MKVKLALSIVSTDMDNILRGLTHDNSDASVTGPAADEAWN